MSFLEQLPEYEPTASLDARPLDTSQATGRLPTAFLPSYSGSIPSRWWEEAAEAVFRTPHDFSLVTLTIKFIPLPDPTIPATLLSGRQKGWLDAFLNILCRDRAIEVSRCDSLLSTAEAIVAIINWRPFSHAPRWEGDWLFPALFGSDIPTVAQKLDSQMHSAFCTITYADWIAWRCGYQKDIVSDLLDALLDFRNALVQFAQQHSIADKLLLLQKALPSQQPLLHWMISTAVSCDTLSGPSDALRFLLDPIEQQFDKQCPSILAVCQRLSILDTRFTFKIIHETDPKWPIPFSIDFSMWERIQRHNPQELAESDTRFVRRLFLNISIEDLFSDDGYMKDVARTWSDLTDDFYACLSANKGLTSYFMHLAENFIRLRNLFTAAAVGLALAKWGYQPHNPSPIWDIINPKDNFAGCRWFMAKNPACLAYIFPYIRELRQSGNAPGKTLEIYQMIIGYLERRQEAEAVQSAGGEKVIGEGTIVHRYLSSQTTHFSSRQLKKNDVLDLNKGALDIKRTKANDNAQHEEINDSRSTNQNVKMRRELSQDASKPLNRYEGIASFPSFQNLPVELRHL